MKSLLSLHLLNYIHKHTNLHNCSRFTLLFPSLRFIRTESSTSNAFSEKQISLQVLPVYLTAITLAKIQICVDIGGPIPKIRDRSNPRTLLDIFKFCLTRSLAKLIEFQWNSLRDPEAQRNSSHAYTRRFQKPWNVVVTIANSLCCHLWLGEGGRRYALPRSTFRSRCCRAVFVYERSRSRIMLTIDVVYTRATFERSYRLRADLIPR